LAAAETFEFLKYRYEVKGEENNVKCCPSQRF